MKSALASVNYQNIDNMSMSMNILFTYSKTQAKSRNFSNFCELNKSKGTQTPNLPI